MEAALTSSATGLHSILHPTVAALFQNRSQKAQPSSTPTVSRAAESSNNHLAGVCWMLGSEVSIPVGPRHLPDRRRRSDMACAGRR